MAGNATMAISNAAAISNPADKGRVTKVEKSPRESSMARRRFSSIIGPSTNPSSSGAGSISSYTKM